MERKRQIDLKAAGIFINVQLPLAIDGYEPAALSTTPQGAEEVRYFAKQNDITEGDKQQFVDVFFAHNGKRK